MISRMLPCLLLCSLYTYTHTDPRLYCWTRGLQNIVKVPYRGPGCNPPVVKHSRGALVSVFLNLSQRQLLQSLFFKTQVTHGVKLKRSSPFLLSFYSSPQAPLKAQRLYDSADFGCAHPWVCVCMRVGAAGLNHPRPAV